MSATETGAETPARRALLWGLLLAVVAAVLEGFAYLTGLLTPDLYDHREAVLARVESGTPAVAARVDPVLGWEPAPGAVLDGFTCLGDPLEYTIAADGARGYPGYEPFAAPIVVAGDSYTFGDEAVDAATFPAVLADLTGAPVANLGVGGYGPVQAVLRLERHLDRYPDARVVVLTIMYENVHRMMNGYRPVLYDGADVRAFLPHMKDGRLRPHPGRAVLADEAALVAGIEAAFDRDFWAKPRHRFPYTLALARGLASEYFKLRTVQRKLSNVGRPEYGMTYETPAIRDNLFALLDRFAAFAAGRGLSPVLLFVPRNRFDTTSVQRLLAEEGGRFPGGLAVADVADGEVDWSRFNLENPADGNVCHPSAYGYRVIAERLAAALP